jgi:hypothetical protein
MDRETVFGTVLETRRYIGRGLRPNYHEGTNMKDAGIPGKQFKQNRLRQDPSLDQPGKVLVNADPLLLPGFDRHAITTGEAHLY